MGCFANPAQGGVAPGYASYVHHTKGCAQRSAVHVPCKPLSATTVQQAGRAVATALFVNCLAPRILWILVQLHEQNLAEGPVGGITC